MPERIERAVLEIGERVAERLHVLQRRVDAGRRLPHTPGGVRAGIQAGEVPEAPSPAWAHAVHRVDDANPWEVGGRIARRVAQIQIRRGPGADVGERAVGRRVDDVERAPRLAQGDRRCDQGGLLNTVDDIEGLRNQQQVEQVHVQQGVDTGLGRLDCRSGWPRRRASRRRPMSTDNAGDDRRPVLGGAGELAPAVAQTQMDGCGQAAERSAGDDNARRFASRHRRKPQVAGAGLPIGASLRRQELPGEPRVGNSRRHARR